MPYQNIGRDAARWLLRCVRLSLALALSSCGGGGPDQANAELQAVDHQVRLANAAAAATAGPTVASVTMLTRLSEKRIDRTVFEYVFSVAVKNGTEPQAGVIASLTGAGAGTTIIDGAVDVGDLAPGATVTPDDTITLRHDRTVPFAADALVWHVSTGNVFRISDYALVSSTLVGGTVFEDTFRARVTNRASGDFNINATLRAAGAGTTIVKAALAFGDVPLGATIESTDTFVVRNDRSVPFDSRALVWTTRATPLARTAFELIDNALAAGLVDAETALLYKVYAEFGDDRLPAQYVGRDITFNEFTLLGVAERQFDSLSPATQQLIAPFLLPPDVPGSWYALRASRQFARILSAKTAATSSWTPDWQAVDGDTTKSKVRVWWDAGNAATAVQDWLDAIRIRDEIDSKIWSKLTQLLGEPLPDAGGELEGGDSRLDIFLVRGSGALTASRRTGCYVEVPGFIRLGEGVDRTNSMVAHELTHAILMARKLKGGCGNFFSEFAWMHEATATWAEHFVYPLVNFEHRTAPWFLEEPEVELEKYEPLINNKPHQYGAYLLFFYLTRVVNDAAGNVVRNTWNAAAGTDSLRAIEAAIGNLGGFMDVWPQFVLRNWNREFAAGQPYRDYYLWDKLDARAKEEVTEAPSLSGKASVTYSLAHRIPHLAARYFHYDLSGDNAIRTLSFTHPYWGGQEATAKVQAIVKIRGQDWRVAEDWTSIQKKTFCRDKPAEDVEELVIVISNSKFTDRTHVLSDINSSGGPPTQLKVSALGCSPWIGSVQFNYTDTFDEPGSQITVSETASAIDVVFEFVDGDEDSANYKATGGVVNWRHTGTASFGFGAVQCAGEAAGAFLASAEFSTLWVAKLDPPIGDDSTWFYSGKGLVANYPQQVVVPIDYACNVGGRYPPTHQLKFLNWLETNPSIMPRDIDHKLIPDAEGNLVMRGSSNFGGGRYTWSWEFKQTRKSL